MVTSETEKRVRDLLKGSRWIGYARDPDGEYTRVVFSSMEQARELYGLLVEMRDKGGEEGGRAEPVAWIHTMHMELGQTSKRLTFTEENPWGDPGWNYSAEYEVTSEPLYKLKGGEQGGEAIEPLRQKPNLPSGWVG